MDGSYLTKGNNPDFVKVYDTDGTHINKYFHGTLFKFWSIYDNDKME